MKARGEGVVVLGAGLAGLAAAAHAGPGVRLFERDARVGGLCATDRVGGYAFDFSGHLLHLRTAEIRRWVTRLLPGALRAVSRDARIHLLGREVRYPFQANAYGLPAPVKAGALRDYLEAAARPAARPANFSAWAHAAFGATNARLFFEPYNRKLWTVEPETLTLDWMGPYVPRPDVPTVIRGAFADQPGGGGYNAEFLYPRRVAEAASRLRSNSVLVVNLGVRRARLHPAHWLYFPEPEFVFYRVGFPSNFGRVAPAGRSSLYAEIALPAGTGWERRRGLAARARRDLIRAGILRADDVVEAEHLQYLPYAYVIFDRDRAEARRVILDYLDRCGIASIGRWGNWEYSAMEDALLAGKRAAAGR